MSADRREASSSERVVATTNGTEGSSGSSITTASGQSRSAKVTETTTARSETRGGKLITTEVTERVKETPRRTVTTAAGGDVSVSGLERVTSKRERVTNTSSPGVREESFRTEIRSTSSFESQSGTFLVCVFVPAACGSASVWAGVPASFKFSRMGVFFPPIFSSLSSSGKPLCCPGI
jgi:hypothetical protein